MDTPRTKRPDFIPYTTEVEITEACDSLIAIINVRRAQLLELLKDRRQKIENLKKCKERAQLEFPLEKSFFTAAVASRWYWTPRIPEEKQSQLYTHLYWKEREAYGSWKTVVVCDKKTFRESLKEIIDVVLEVTNPKDMMYKTATYKRGVLAEGREGRNEGEYKHPCAIAYYDTAQELFIADSWNRIAVCFRAGKYLHQFGKGILKQPYGLVLAPDCFYVTDYNSHALFKFSRPDCQLMGRTLSKHGSKRGQFINPRQLAINPANSCLYVCDTGNHMVSVYSTDLQYQYSITDKAIKYPRDVKFNNNEMFVLVCDNNGLLVFNCNYKLVRTLLPYREIFQDYNIAQLHNPYYFCIDRYSNILVSDYNADIKIFSPIGKLLHNISKKGHGVGELYNAKGISVTNTGNIICVSSSNINHTVQIFY